MMCVVYVLVPSRLRLVRANILLYTYDHSFYELEFDMLTYFSTVADQQRT